MRSSSLHTLVWRRPLDLQRYVCARPYLYHLTHQANLNHLRETGCLIPAAILMQRAGCPQLIRARRRTHERIIVDGREIVIRDQAPLHAGKMRLPKGYNFEDFVEHLNRRIFFWPGSDVGPISYGMRHFQRYRRERPLILRVDFDSLLRSNPAANPLFCRYNSGSPRCSNGKKIPRGPHMFVSTADFVEAPSRVVEVTFDIQIVLPPNTEFSERPTGPWRLLF